MRQHDDVAPPSGGAVNHTYRQTTRRGVCCRMEGESCRTQKNYMYKKLFYLFLIFSACFLFFLCKSPLKKNNEIITEYTDEEKSAIKITDHYNYFEERKKFSIGTVKHLEFLEGFSKEELAEAIERLSVFDDEINDLKFIERFPQLKGLTIQTEGSLNNIESLAYLHNIEYLDIWNTKIAGISPVTNLKSLKYLSLNGCEEISNISSISNLENLEELSISSCNNIESILPVFELLNLKKLTLYFKNQPDLTQIKKLKKLEYFESPVIINENMLNDFLNLKQLKKINILYAAVKDINPLLNLPNFETMECMLDLHKAIFNCNEIQNSIRYDYAAAAELDAGIKTVRQLLEAGANLNEKKNILFLRRNQDSYIYSLDREITPLMQSRTPGVTELLIKYGARVNDRDKYGITALMISAFFDGYYNWSYNNDANLIAKMLINNGADVNIKKNTGQTALYLAVIGYNIASIELLIKNGANVNLRDNKGLSPLMAAKIFHHQDYAERHKEIVQILVNAGAVIDDADIQMINELKKERDWTLSDVLEMGYGDR
jgi:ankyrin repeat protein